LCEIIDPDNDQLSITISEGTVLRFTRRFYIGFLGALFVSYSFLYAYIIGLFGGHRSLASHGWFIGTIGRMIFYNIPFFIFMNVIYLYGTFQGWFDKESFYEIFKFEVWVYPYLQSQFVAWFIGDATHLILDTEWAKGILYTPTMTKRNPKR